MDYLVCPIDTAQLKLIEVRWGAEDRPLLRCPRCSKRFLLTRSGTLNTVPKPEPSR